jgi:nitrous oxidase accessory protein NosD
VNRREPQNVTIVNNRLHTVGTNGIVIEYDDHYKGDSSNILIANNMVIDVGSEGIQITQGVAAIGNTVIGCSRGIQVRDSDQHAVILGNTIISCTYGIYEDGAGDYNYFYYNSFCDCSSNIVGYSGLGANTETCTGSATAG